jgi:hypothetical protein
MPIIMSSTMPINHEIDPETSEYDAKVIKPRPIAFEIVAWLITFDVMEQAVELPVSFDDTVLFNLCLDVAANDYDSFLAKLSRIIKDTDSSLYSTLARSPFFEALDDSNPDELRLQRSLEIVVGIKRQNEPATEVAYAEGIEALLYNRHEIAVFCTDSLHQDYENTSEDYGRPRLLRIISESYHKAQIFLQEYYEADNQVIS